MMGSMDLRNIQTALGAFQRRFLIDLAMIMKSMKRTTAVTRVRMQTARIAPSLFGEVEVPVKARMNCFPISITWLPSPFS